MIAYSLYIEPPISRLFLEFSIPDLVDKLNQEKIKFFNVDFADYYEATVLELGKPRLIGYQYSLSKKLDKDRWLNATLTSKVVQESEYGLVSGIDCESLILRSNI